VAPLARALPAQNVAFIVLFLILVELAVEYWQGPRICWLARRFWPAAILWLRFGTQFILKSWRQNRNYGIFLLALPGIVTGAVQLVFSPRCWMVGRCLLTAGCLAFLMPGSFRRESQLPRIQKMRLNTTLAKAQVTMGKMETGVARV